MRGGARLGAGRPKKGEIRVKLPKADPNGTHIPPVPKIEAPEVQEPTTAKTPLQYMLDVMNDAGADEKLRCQMAVSAAPYMHAKKGDSGSTKDEQADKAKQAAQGRFKSAAPPLKLVARK
jgi:phage terminase small subunit